MWKPSLRCVSVFALEVGSSANELLPKTWTQKAADYCERFPNPRKVEVVQRNLEAVQAALKDRERRQGASIEEIAEELHRKKTALDTARKEIKALNSLNRVREPCPIASECLSHHALARHRL